MSVLKFGDFQLDVSQRRLTRGSGDIKLGSRALDLLIALASRPGEVISKDELLRLVWPETIVADGALRVNMFAVRKALESGADEKFIQSIAGRGYVFTARSVSSRPTQANANSSLQGKHNLPADPIRIIGREEFITNCLKQSQQRVLSIIGPGGIGKTTVAIKIAHLLRSDFEATFFLDLGAINDPKTVGPTLASLLGLSVYGDDPVPGIVGIIGDRKILVIFDNCEHVVDRAAEIVEAIGRSCPHAYIVATSRETLGVSSESIKRLGPLSIPPHNADASILSKSAAIALFLERVKFSLPDQSFEGEAQLQLIATIVRKLDGIPLAIEFAAARAVDLGLTELISSLDQPLMILRRGRRTAPPRQQTLQATLDWSYKSLSEGEKTLLRVLSVFAQSFDRSAALLVGSFLLDEEAFNEALWGLLSKSLLARSDADDVFRLLETTRSYALAKLVESEWEVNVRTAHANFVRERLLSAEKDWDQLVGSDWAKRYGSLMHDIRAAIAFAARTGMTRLHLELAADSGLIWTQMGLMKEHFQIIEQALDVIDEGGASDHWLETQLRSSYGAIAYNVLSVEGDEEGLRQFELAALSAEAMQDTGKTLRARSGICAILTTQGRYREANDVAHRLSEKVGPESRSAVDRILAHNSHYLGQHVDASYFAHQALNANGGNMRGTLTSGANFGQKTLSLMVLAKTSWLRGQSQTALDFLDELTSNAIAVDHAISLCLALSVGACPIYFGLGLREEGKRYLGLLRDVSTRHSLIRWQEWADGYDEAVATPTAGWKAAVTESLRRGANGPRLENTVVVAGTRAPMGLIDIALMGQAGWCQAELFRLKGVLLVEKGQTEGVALIEKGYELAAEQSSLVWQLRCANSLAELAIGGGKYRETDKIERTLALFTEAVPAMEMAVASKLLEGVSVAADG